MFAAERLLLMKQQWCRFPLTCLQFPLGASSQARNNEARGAGGSHRPCREQAGGQPRERSWAGCEIWRGEIRQRQRKEAYSQEPRENLQLLWRRWDRLKALVFCTALLFSSFISEMKEVGNDFLCILLGEASRHIFWLYSSLCLLSRLSCSLTPERVSGEAAGLFPEW